MKSVQLKKVREAVKILKKDPIAQRCIEFCWGCFQCDRSRLIEELITIVEEHLQSDKEIEAYIKKYNKMKKKNEKNNPI